MKHPRTFKTGEPSYLNVASTSGSARPTALTAANASTGGVFGRRFIEPMIFGKRQFSIRIRARQLR